MEDAGDRRARAGADIGRGARDRAGRRESREQGRGDVGDAHAHQLLPRTVPPAGHPVRDGGREQRLNPREEGDDECQLDSGLFALADQVGHD